jgi:hypothetical protein
VVKKYFVILEMETEASSSVVSGGRNPLPKKSVYNKERYEQNKEDILKYRRERYRTIHKKDLNIKVSTGTFTLYFD